MKRNQGATEERRIIICGTGKDSMPYLQEVLESRGQKAEFCPDPGQLEPLVKDLDPCLVIMMWGEGKPLWEPVISAFGQKYQQSSRLLMAVTPSLDAIKATQELGAHEVIYCPFQKEELFFRITALQNQISYLKQLKAADILVNVKAAEEKARFFGMIGRLAHDLNTPLSAAYMGCDLLMSPGGEKPAPPQQKTIEQINFSLGELKRALAAVGDWVRLCQGQLKPTLGPMQWKDLLEIKKEDWAELEALARRDQKKILIEAPSGLPSALADKELIGRALILLINHSLQYTRKGDQIKVKVNRDEKGENLIFCIEDPGQNIPPSLGDIIFDWGISREEHLKGLRWGRGLGLNFCKQAVEVCGGKIWAESGEEPGSRFYVKLPLWAEGQGNNQQAASGQ